VEKSPDVERWFADRQYEQEPMMRRLREIILMADPRVSEYLKYGTVIFGYEGDMVSFVGMNKKPFTLMFNRGARIPGRFPHLEGTHPSARFMRFKDVAEVKAHAGELTRVVEAWCELVAPTVGSAKPGVRTAAANGAKTGNARPKTSAAHARAKRATSNKKSP
jgi:hypothetical protein